ncbi:MAG: hypothetical protein DRN06_08455 [Thermoprotei archaeon]|nr:MAG: hypothetical protein DRN06_08455 [Thermoprotei archaeon]
MELIKSGAYLTESFKGREIDLSKWQFWRMDPSMEVEVGEGFLHIHGTTSKDVRSFTGLTTRRLYPADAVLIVEMSMPCDYDQEGTFGFVAHLCNRVLGDEIKILSIPDNNCEVTFGRMGEKLGWFFWWLNHMSGEFHKWIRDEEPLEPFGDEAVSFRTVRLSYDAETNLLEGSILEGGKWIRIGRPVRFQKHFSSIELKIDAQARGLDLDLRFRNCRLFPNPRRNPLRVFVGDPSPKVGATVELLDMDGQVISRSGVNPDGLAVLHLPEEGNFPLSGRLRVLVGGEVVDWLEVVSDGVSGIYPGDFYASPGDGNL